LQHSVVSRIDSYPLPLPSSLFISICWTISSINSVLLFLCFLLLLWLFFISMFSISFGSSWLRVVWLVPQLVLPLLLFFLFFVLLFSSVFPSTLPAFDTVCSGSLSTLLEASSCLCCLADSHISLQTTRSLLAAMAGCGTRQLGPVVRDQNEVLSSCLELGTRRMVSVLVAITVVIVVFALEASP